MAPRPQKHSSTRKDLLETVNNVQVPAEFKTKIAISGISGMFPAASSVKELSEILYNKVNPVGSDNLRWNYKHPEVTKYAGVAPGIDRFDAQFFTVYHRLGHYMDPMSRKMLEHTYQAIYDAGINPAQLSGKKVAVFVGSSYSIAEHTGMADYHSKTGLGIVGCSKTMFANRISYWLNVKGPSVSIDEADCSSIMALEQAYEALKRGDCEAAIVAGGFLNIHPHCSIFHRRSAGISSDGKTKSFSEDANGYTLSDAVGVVFLQKAEDALRIYAELKHVKNEFISQLNDDMGQQYGFIRNPETTANFIKEFYKETQTLPQDVEYVEAYGTGILEADKIELEALAKVYCEDRTDPLLVGSVTSNIGLTDAASGIAGLTKVILGLYFGKMSANLHCSKPRKDVQALLDGRMRIVTEHEPVYHTYAALNGMSATGTNSHVLLQAHFIPKDISLYKSTIPYLIPISGRQESAVEKIFEDLKSRPIDPEELALLHNIHSTNISGHLGRGYLILGQDEKQSTLSLCEKNMYFDNAARPLWFVYSGMGSQWAGMGAQLMRIPIFAAAIERCRKVLEPKGLDIIHIITSPDKTIFDNILHSFVGIAAVQIGLTDVLRELGLVPDGIIGHSVGELGCAYADGCLSDEEMILAAYSRGLVSLETKLIRGSMAAVGVGYAQISKMCPPEIDVACRNGPDSSTISGPADVMKKFVAELTAKDIFAKEVPCSNIAYHSRYIADAGANLLKYLKQVIKNPKPRSQRWLSSSVPQDKWNDELAKYCSAEYQTNNLLSPVLFEETSRLIPSNAVLVEVAPHGLLQAILKRSMSPDCRHVPLTKRGHADNGLHLLQAIGDIYMEGYSVKVQALYPKVRFPVSTTTPMLSHLPEWVHAEEWFVSLDQKSEVTSAANYKPEISIYDEQHSFLRGNVIRGKTCYPFSAALVAVWDTLAMSLSATKKELSVHFLDVHLYAQPLLYNQRPLNLNITIHRGTGRFEVISEHSKIASGYILQLMEKTKELRKIHKSSEDMALTSQDVYQLLEDKELSYRGEFRSIDCASASLKEAALEWNNNWACLIDGMLQLNVLRQQHNSVSLPTSIRRICIDVREHRNGHKYFLNTKGVMTAYVDDVYDYTRCGGVLLHTIKYRHLPSVTRDQDSFELVAQPTTGIKQNILESNRVTLQSSQIGKLDSLQWVETPLDTSNDMVTVHYAGLNMLDVKKATAVTLSDSNIYGMDYSGVTKSGERVMGLVHAGAACTQIRPQPELVWPVPAHWTLEDAATVPLAYVQAFYCLTIRGHLRAGMNILVHGGAGGLGQAAIAIALAYDCQVFTTVSSIHKKQYLQKLYPQLKDQHIISRRDGNFADEVLFATQGKGCDIVISSVKGDLKNASLRCLAFSGRVIDTVQIDNREKYEFGMFFLTRQRSYTTVDVSSIFTENKYEDMRALHAMLSEGISRGYVRPLSRVTYAPHDAPRAFRLLAASRHRGRVLLNMQHETPITAHRLSCDSDECHLLLWNDDVLGTRLADKLIQRGVKKLYINYSNPSTYHDFKIESWRKQGVEVVLSSTDLRNVDAVTTEVQNAKALGEIAGVYVVYGQNDDDAISKDANVILKNVDAASRSLDSLKYFLVTSTAGCFGKDLCSSRSESGLPATFLDLSSVWHSNNNKDVTEAIERALCSSHVVLSARSKPEQSSSLLEQLAAVCGINIPSNANPEDTLKKLGILDEKVPEICSFLNINHNISMDEDQVALLTVRRINEMEKSVVEVVRQKKKGLSTFIQSASFDELLATTEVAVLPTLYRDLTLSKGEFDVSLRYLCIVPGIEGHHERFRTMCERLKLPAFVLQPGLDHPNETLHETARRLANILITKGLAQDKFYLLGYESGIIVALEIAKILEERGLTGTVFCMGCEPDALKAELDEQLSELVTEEQLQNAVARHMYALLAEGESAELDQALQLASTWPQKVDACMRHLLGRMSNSTQYARALIEVALARIEQVRCFKSSTFALRSQIVLLRAVTAHAPAQHTSLQRYSHQPVAVYQMESDLAYVATDAQSASLINQHLDAETLNTFESRNQCEPYYINEAVSLA